MSIVAPAPARIHVAGRPDRRFRFRPRFRGRELGLLAIVAVALYVGAMSLGATERFKEALADGSTGAISLTRIAEPGLLLAYIAALFAVHGIFVAAGRRTDQLLLPAVGLLGGIGLLLMIRLPQSLAGSLGGLAQTQLVWLLIGLAIVAVLGVAVRNDVWLRRYKYTWAAVGVGLLLLTFVFGNDVNGARLTLSLGPVSGQPSELLKVILVIFLAGYLSENRPLLVEESTRIGPIRLPPLPYLAPMVAMWAIALGIVIVQRDLGAALLFFAVFLLLLYVSTARVSFVVLGLAAFVIGAVALYFVFGHVRTRVDVWLDPFADASGSGYQIVQALHAFARGGLIGTGLGGGLPTVAGRPPIPALHTDFPVRGPRGGARARRDPRDPRPVPRPGAAWPPDRLGGAGRVPRDSRCRPVPRYRGPGLHHRRRQPQADPAHRHHAAVHQLWRLVAPRERGDRRAADRPLRSGQGAVGAAAATWALPAAARPGRGLTRRGPGRHVTSTPGSPA